MFIDINEFIQLIMRERERFGIYGNKILYIYDKPHSYFGVRPHFHILNVQNRIMRIDTCVSNWLRPVSARDLSEMNFINVPQNNSFKIKNLSHL